MARSYDDRLEEIRIGLDNGDLNRVGQRLIDLCFDFRFDDGQRKTSLDLRERYNLGKELGKKVVDDPRLRSDFEEFFAQLRSVQNPPVVTDTPKRVIAKVRGIYKSFRSRLHNFHFEPISFDLTLGHVVGVVGENGNGKTTLLRMLAGELSVDGGSIEFRLDGRVEEAWDEIRRNAVFIPQRTRRWFGIAQERLSFEAAVKGIKGRANHDKVEYVLHRMGLSNFRELSWAKLSSGYKLRFEIAMALVGEPSILILDEPLANLDIQAQAMLLEDLRNLADSVSSPVGIILSSQQLHEVESIADQIIFLKNGRAVYNGSLSKFQEAETEHTFEVMGDFTHAQLSHALATFKNIQIQQSASAFVITADLSFTKEQLLRSMMEYNLDIGYFRNITGSTKKLFSDKY